VDCCHANQDKFWVQDPDGVDWEVYHLNYDLEDEPVASARTRVAAAIPSLLPLGKAGGCCSS